MSEEEEEFILGYLTNNVVFFIFINTLKVKTGRKVSFEKKKRGKFYGQFGEFNQKKIFLPSDCEHLPLLNIMFDLKKLIYLQIFSS